MLGLIMDACVLGGGVGERRTHLCGRALHERLRLQLSASLADEPLRLGQPPALQLQLGLDAGAGVAVVR